jgi:uncharacterized protein YcaQ
MKLELKQAQNIALSQQLYRQQQLFGKEGLRQLITQLGYVQIDTISVVERAHHHTVWSRISDYNKDHLDELQANDRAIFEYWGHAASYLPMEDYRFALPRMHSFPDANSWERQFFDKYRHLMDDVLKRISQEGPLGAKDFSDDRSEKPVSGWGSEKPAKLALDLLFWKGELMISRRQGFQRIYDLRERVLPPGLDTSFPSKEELFRYYILRSLNAMGIGSLIDIQSHFMVSGKAQFQPYLNNLLESGEVIENDIPGLKDKHYLLPHALECLNIPETVPEQLYLLSPFDNVVILRQRIKRLFNFDYTLECYVTPSKRKYGYWCLPILYKQQFIGRLDCKANRAQKQMEIVTLHLEPDVKPNADLKRALQHTFDSFSLFCGCKSTKVI